jgi:hypothetical protein
MIHQGFYNDLFVIELTFNYFVYLFVFLLLNN